MKVGSLYESVLRQFTKKTFRFWQQLGLHITLNHFYLPIPDTAHLSADLWNKPSKMIGIEINEFYQLDLLSELVKCYKAEYERWPPNKTAVEYQYYSNNVFFESADAEILYCIIRHFKPKKIFEFGSGFSTLVSAEAARKNTEGGDTCEFLAFEPYPKSMLRENLPGLTKLIVAPLQSVSLAQFDELKENDILFVDSSHVLKIGSDVHYLFLEVLPRLNKGVLVHFHDIFLPMEYSKAWVLNRVMFYTEQYMLQAFLSFNPKFQVVWAGNYMHLRYPDKLAAAFTSYVRDRRIKAGERVPSSFWIRRVN